MRRVSLSDARAAYRLARLVCTALGAKLGPHQHDDRPHLLALALLKLR